MQAKRNNSQSTQANAAPLQPKQACGSQCTSRAKSEFSFSRGLMDSLAEVLQELSLAGDKAGATWEQKGKAIIKALTKRGADGLLEEFVSWFNLAEDE